jgi:hypothetical protein
MDRARGEPLPGGAPSGAVNGELPLGQQAPLDAGPTGAYHFGMRRDRLHWTLVFTAASLEHLAERGVDADDVAAVVFGHYGPAWLRRGGRGRGERWFAMGPLGGGELLTCILRRAEPRDLEGGGAFVIPSTGFPEDPGTFADWMRLCVSARMSHDDEARAYRLWRRSKRGR